MVTEHLSRLFPRRYSLSQLLLLAPRLAEDGTIFVNADHAALLLSSLIMAATACNWYMTFGVIIFVVVVVVVLGCCCCCLCCCCCTMVCLIGCSCCSYESRCVFLLYSPCHMFSNIFHHPSPLPVFVVHGGITGGIDQAWGNAQPRYLGHVGWGPYLCEFEVTSGRMTAGVSSGR